MDLLSALNVNVAEDLPEGSALEVIEGASHVAYIEKPYHRDFQDRLAKFLYYKEKRLWTDKAGQ